MDAIDPSPGINLGINLEALPPTFPVQVASKILGIGRNRTYALITAGWLAGRFTEPSADARRER